MIRKSALLTLIIIVTLFPIQSREGMKLSVDQPSTGFASNSVGDIVYMALPGGDTIIWVGTGNGLSQSTDGGLSWVTYSQQNGLNQDDISAMAGRDSTLWVATAYSKLVQGEPVPYGRGFNRSDDLGKSWKSFIPSQVDFAGKIAYDIAIDDTTVWAACWYGGLIRSQDFGQTWQNVFVDSFARKDFEEGSYQFLTNRFFAIAVDTVCPIEKKLENSITDIAYDGTLLWVATQSGLHASLSFGASWFSPDTTGGLDSIGVFCLAADTSSLWVGLYKEEKTYPLPLFPSLTGMDFNYTTNYGLTWNVSHPSQGQTDSIGKFAFNIVLVDTVIWAACGKGGLIRSFDRGQTWSNVFADTSAERRFQEDQLLEEDIFTALTVDTSAIDATVVWAGTRDGIYKFIFTTSDSPDTVLRYLYFLWKGGSGTGPTEGPVGVVSIGIQDYDDHKEVWVGAYSFYTYNPTPDDIYPITLRSTDGGETWNGYLSGIQTRDFAFSDSTVWVATHQGLKRSRDGGLNWDTFEIVDSLSKQLMVPSYFTSVCVVKDTLQTMIFVGSKDGLARSTDDGTTWEVTRFVPSFKKAIWAGTAAGIYKFTYNYGDVFDTAINYNSYQDSITGDWVVSLAIQKYNGKKVIWAGTHVAYSGENGASFSADDGDTWETTLLGDLVWNFAFDDSIIWVATSSGLKRSSDGGKNWQIFNYMQDKDEITENRIFTSEFTSVAIINGEIWAGNADGLVISKDKGASWDVIRIAAPIGTEGSMTAYAYPSPFSPIVQEGQVTRIHHRPLRDGPVTIKIYDFAMNLVKTIVNGEHRVGGVEYDEPWDGKNEKKEIVVNGVYFFKVEAPGGQTEWGKLVVLK